MYGEKVGEDEFGNRYYRTRGGKIDRGLGFERRWVIYNGYMEASTIPPSWHGWMHHTVDTPPTQETYKPHDWQKPHRPNMTGTAGAYRPPGSTLAANRRPKATGDYKAWSPDSRANWQPGPPFRRRIRRVNRALPWTTATAPLGQRRKQPVYGANFRSPLAGSSVAALLATPAFAQSIFNDFPPRPPADVPNAPPSNPQPPPYYPSQRPQGGVRSDQPPAQPLPAPMSLPPSSRPGGGTIQSQPLPPPPGVAPAPPPGQAPQAAYRRRRRLPGLPPGQRQPRGAPPQPADTAPQPGDEIVVEPPPQRITNPTAVFAGLDKITGRIISFDVAINETVQFGALQVTPRVCYSRPPTETPNTDAFVEVDEVTLQGEIKRIFTGWMFAASPGLHAVEHPIYDVWLTDCKGGQNPNVAEAPTRRSRRPSSRRACRRGARRRRRARSSRDCFAAAAALAPAPSFRTRAKRAIRNPDASSEHSSGFRVRVLRTRPGTT